MVFGSQEFFSARLPVQEKCKNFSFGCNPLQERFSRKICFMYYSRRYVWSANMTDSKVKCSGVAMKEKKHENVKLKEEDVPGAISPRET